MRSFCSVACLGWALLAWPALSKPFDCEVGSRVILRDFPGPAVGLFADGVVVQLSQGSGLQNNATVKTKNISFQSLNGTLWGFENNETHEIDLSELEPFPSFFDPEKFFLWGTSAPSDIAQHPIPILVVGRFKRARYLSLNTVSAKDQILVVLLSEVVENPPIIGVYAVDPSELSLARSRWDWTLASLVQGLFHDSFDRVELPVSVGIPYNRVFRVNFRERTSYRLIEWHRIGGVSLAKRRIHSAETLVDERRKEIKAAILTAATGSALQNRINFCLSAILFSRTHLYPKLGEVIIGNRSS